MNELLESALSAVKRGWHVLPIYPALPGGSCSCPKGKECKNIGKHPLAELVPRGQTDATTEESTVRAWWTQRPDASVAIVLMPSGLLALDVDIYHDDDKKLEALILEHGRLPDTVQQNSGSKEGVHLLFRNPGIPVRGVIGGIVTRSHNYIVIAPSLHKSGARYEWEEGLTPNDIEAAHLPPKWVIALSKEAGIIGGIGVIPDSAEPEWLKKIDAEERIEDMRLHVASQEPEIMGQSEPGRMFNIARTAARGFAVRDPEKVYEALKAYNEKCVPPYDLDKLAERVYAAYEKAYSPLWGDALQMRAVNALTKSISSPPTEEALESTLRAYVRKTAHTKNDVERHKHDAIDRILKYKLGKPQVTSPAEILFTAETLVLASPEGTISEQIAIKMHGLVSGASMEDLITLVEGIKRIERPDEANAPTSDVEVMKLLETNDKGIISSGSNIELILRYSDAFRDKIMFNEITRNIEIDGGGMFEISAKKGKLDIKIKNWLEKKWRLRASKDEIGDQLSLIAMEYGSYDPVADYLDGLVWDGKERIDTWLTTYCSVKDSEYARKVGARWLISGAARGLCPGEKVDTVLILKGNQGIRKSTAFDILGGSWFSDSSLDLSNKDARITAASTWVIELPELAALGQRELEKNKAFISGRRDKVRPPYGKVDIDFERHCVFGGTTNAEEFLIDETGNRRFWVVAILKYILTQKLRDDRDQLWAEAVVRYREACRRRKAKGHLEDEKDSMYRWWFEGEEQILADKEARKSTVGDLWVDVLIQWAERQNTLTSSALGLPAPSSKNAWRLADIAKNALGIEPADLQRHSKALGRALRSAGFERRKSRVGGKQPNLWYWDGSGGETIEVEDVSAEDEEPGITDPARAY